MTYVPRKSDKRLREFLGMHLTFPTVSNTVEEYQRFKVEEGKQMLVFREMTVDGELVVDGEVVIFE